MDDHDDLLASEMAEHSTPPPTASNIANDLQPCTQRCRKNRSRVWDHFTPDLVLEYKRATCNHCQRVCLTTDTWISNQNLRYMCLIAHFIDNNWKLSNKILNFCQVTGHSRKVMAKFWEGFLNSWGLHDIKSYH